MLQLILYGIAYLGLVYFMIVLLKGGDRPLPGKGGDDGGISINNLPDLDDLPPGITLSDGSLPRRRTTRV
jgi:hypothetical protein